MRAGLHPSRLFAELGGDAERAMIAGLMPLLPSASSSAL
jgi:hypothetical protein